MVSKAQQKAVSKYVKANYDRLELIVPKGKKVVIKAHAQGQGESVNAFINRAIEETMERDTAPQRPGEAKLDTTVQNDTPAYNANQTADNEGTESVPLHTLEQRVRRILYKHGATIKKNRKTGGYTIVSEGGSHIFPDFLALSSYAKDLDNQ